VLTPATVASVLTSNEGARAAVAAIASALKTEGALPVFASTVRADRHHAARRPVRLHVHPC